MIEIDSKRCPYREVHYLYGVSYMIDVWFEWVVRGGRFGA
jgi:hypothetical protein